MTGASCVPAFAEAKSAIGFQFHRVIALAQPHAPLHLHDFILEILGRDFIFAR